MTSVDADAAVDVAVDSGGRAVIEGVDAASAESGTVVTGLGLRDPAFFTGVAATATPSEVDGGLALEPAAAVAHRTCGAGRACTGVEMLLGIFACTGFTLARDGGPANMIRVVGTELTWAVHSEGPGTHSDKGGGAQM